MLALRTLLKPNIMTTVVRPLVIRGSAVVPPLVIRGFSTRPIVRPNVTPSPHVPVTTNPHYEVKESQLDYQIDMDLPPEKFNPEEIAIEISPDTKHIHVTGTHQEAGRTQHFEKDFDSGHALDVSHLETDYSNGHLHVEAKKAYVPASILAETPITATPGYDIKESMSHFAVYMNIPQAITPEEVKVEFQPDAKGVRIMGGHGNIFFDKRFTAGHALDFRNFKTVVDQGYLHFEAPKTHA